MHGGRSARTRTRCADRWPAAPAWLLLAVVAATVAVSAAAAAATRCPAAGCGQDPAKVSLSGIDLGQAVVAILAVLAISGEYGTGMIRATLTAMPRRTTVLAAKAAVLTGLVLAAGTRRGARLGAGRAAHPARPRLHPGARLPAAVPGRRAVLRAAAGSVLYLALIGLLGLGVATAVRDSAAAIGVVLGLLYLFPVVAAAVSQPALAAAPGADRADVRRAGHPGHHRPARPAVSPWQGLAVLAAWAAGALLAGGLLLRLRDA